MNHCTTTLRSGLGMLLLLAASLAGAHDVYVDSGLRVFYGHSGKAEPYPEEKVRALAAWDAGGHSLAIETWREEGITHVRTAGAAALIAVVFDNGLYARTPSAERFVPGGRDLHPQATEVRRFLKYGKTLWGPSTAVTRVTGAELELVPVAWPEAGSGHIALRVLYGGRPLAGASVLYDGDDLAAAVRTDADGVARLPWTDAAEQRYTARHETPGTAAVDRIVHAAALLVVAAR